MGERITISRKAAKALYAVVMGDWTDDLQHAMDELKRELDKPEPACPGCNDTGRWVDGGPCPDC